MFTCVLHFSIHGSMVLSASYTDRFCLMSLGSSGWWPPRITTNNSWHKAEHWKSYACSQTLVRLLILLISSRKMKRRIIWASFSLDRGQKRRRARWDISPSCRGEEVTLLTPFAAPNHERMINDSLTSIDPVFGHISPIYNKHLGTSCLFLAIIIWKTSTKQDPRSSHWFLTASVRTSIHVQEICKSVPINQPRVNHWLNGLDKTLLTKDPISTFWYTLLWLWRLSHPNIHDLNWVLSHIMTSASNPRFDWMGIPYIFKGAVIVFEPNQRKIQHHAWVFIVYLREYSSAICLSRKVRFEPILARSMSE